MITDKELITEARGRGLEIKEPLSQRSRRKLLRRLQNDDLVAEAPIWREREPLEGRPVDRVAVRVTRTPYRSF